LQQSFDDREVAGECSQPDGTVVVARRVEHRLSEQTIDESTWPF
jgi:hypothetical protein